MDKSSLPHLAQWFSFEERDPVRKALVHLRDLGVKELRVIFSWADWLRPGGREWFDFFVGTLAKAPGLRLVPCLMYTPPQLARRDGDGKALTSYPPNDASDFASFVRDMVDAYGGHFDWIQLWNEPNWKPYWNDDLDPDWSVLVDMVRQGSIVARSRGKKVALGGQAPLELPWFARMEEKGLLRHLDAVGFHYAPSWPNQHRRWFALETEVHALRAMLDGFGEARIEIWLDEAGISTKTPYESDQAKLEQEQIRFFDRISALPVEKKFWYCLFDQKLDTPTDDMLNMDAERDITAYYFGLVRSDGTKKPLYGHWKETTSESTKASEYRK